MNYYELLEISPSASVEVVRNAYKTLAKKYHPDTYKGDTSFAEEKMKLLNEAVSVLEDEAKRKEYNKINGINPLSRSGYSDYGRGNMINVDENGEPIFFSYDMDGDSEDYDKPEKNGESYMEIIDDFIKNNNHPKEKPKNSKPPKKKKNEIIPDEVITGIAADIAEINAKKFGSDSISENIEPEDDDEFDIKISRKKKKKTGKTKLPFNGTRLYYIIIAFLIMSIICVSILISQKVNCSNLSDLFSGSGNNPDEESDPAVNIGPEENFTGENTEDKSDATAEQTSAVPTSGEEPTDSGNGNTAETEQPTTPTPTPEPATAPKPTEPPKIGTPTQIN